ncbi:hypothetical protein [Bacillus sp. FJAT-52991]|uniref:Uncharacterized protein n=1 Tax=Bacillus kandeliae TaxID=3129297 RepID=A0ABZ2N7T5_9BACI
MKKINDQLAMEKMSEHFCIVEEKCSNLLLQHREWISLFGGKQLFIKDKSQRV